MMPTSLKRAAAARALDYVKGRHEIGASHRKHGGSVFSIFWPSGFVPD